MPLERGFLSPKAMSVVHGARPTLSYSVPSQAPTLPAVRLLVPVGPTGSILTGLEKTIVFGGEWFFKEKGVEKVRKRFNQAIEEKDLAADLVWDEMNFVWVARCITGVAHLGTITCNIIASIIEEEHLQDYYSEDGNDDGDTVEIVDEDGLEITFKSDMIIRLSVWKRKNNRPEEDAGSELKDLQDTTLLVDELEEESAFPPSVRAYTEKMAWNYYLAQPHSDPFNDKIIGEVARLTSCKCEKGDLNQNIIFIGGASEQACRKAISKFDNIRKNSEPRPEYTSHVFYAEDVGKVEYQIKFFKDVSLQYFQTTLLDNLALSPFNDYDNLNESLTIRCAEWNELKGVFVLGKTAKIQPATPITEVESISRYWNGYTFKGMEIGNKNALKAFKTSSPPIQEQLANYRGEPTILSKHITETQAANTSAIMGWVEQIPSTAAHKYLETLSADCLNPATAFEQMKNPVPDTQIRNLPKPQWDTYADYQGPEIVASQPDTQNKISACLERHIAAFQQPPISPGSEVAHRSLNALKSPILYQDRYGLLKANPATFESQFVLDGNEFPKLPIISSHGPSPALVDEALVIDATSLIESAKPDPDSLTPSALSIVSEHTSAPLTEASVSLKASADLADLKFTAPGPLNLMDDDDYIYNFALAPALQPTQLHGGLEEVRQQNDEVSTRYFYNTMNQMAPKLAKRRGKNPYPGRLSPPSPPRVPQQLKLNPKIKPNIAANPLPEFISQMDNHFQQLVAGFRGFHGEADVRVEFGRIIFKDIRRELISKGKSARPHDADKIIKALNAEQGSASPRNYFTKVLTTVPLDIQHLIEITSQNGDRLWASEVGSYDVYYEFSCHHMGPSGYQPFTIEVNGDQHIGEHRIKKKHEFGELNVHGTRRQWDFRLAAIGYEKPDKLNPSYERLATAIAGSMYIEPNFTKPTLTFELESELLSQNSLQLNGVRVYRVNRFNSMDGRSILNIAEIYDLDVNSNSIQKKDWTIYHAIPNTAPRPGCDKVDYWHEVSISSVKAEEQLLQNSGLELGNETEWTPESLSALGVPEAMYLPACIMLKQMDGVGFWNDSGVDPAKAARTPDAQDSAASYQFW